MDSILVLSHLKIYLWWCGLYAIMEGNPIRSIKKMLSSGIISSFTYNRGLAIKSKRNY